MSTHKVDNIQESTPGAGVTVQGLKAPGLKASIPLFNSAAARDAFFPAPFGDETAGRKDTGRIERYDAGMGRWLPEGLTRAAGPIVTAQSQGLVADGITDDAPFLASADTKCVASGGRHEIDALTATQTKVFIDSNLTLSGHFRPNPGMKSGIYVNAGKTLTINGQYDPGFYTCIDPTSPGMVVFNKTRSFRAEWFGLGLGADDAAILTAIQTWIPDGSSVLWDHVMNMTFLTPWSFVDHGQVTFLNRAGFGTVKIKWHGAYRGTMASWNRVDHCAVIGFDWQKFDGVTIMLGGRVSMGTPNTVFVDGYQPLTDANFIGRQVIVRGAGVAGADYIGTMNGWTNSGQFSVTPAMSTAVAPTDVFVGATATSGPALIALDCDLIGGSAYVTTEDMFGRNRFNGGLMDDEVDLRISHTSGSNCEFMDIFNNYHYPYLSLVYGAPNENGSSVSVASGSATVTANSSFFTTNMIGSTIEINDALGITVAAPGAVQGATSLPVNALVAALPNEALIRLSGGGIAMLTAAAVVGAVALTVRPLERAVAVAETGTSPCNYRIASLVGASPSAQCVMTGVASNTAAGRRVLMNTARGIGLQIGPSSNALKHKVYGNHYLGRRVGIHQKAGSMDPVNNTFSQNGYDVLIDGGDMTIAHSDCENSRSFVKLGAGSNTNTLKIIGGRYGVVMAALDGFYMDFNGRQPSVTVEDLAFAGSLEADWQFWNLAAGFSGRFYERNVNYGSNITLAQHGLNGLSSGGAAIGESPRFITGINGITYHKLGIDLIANPIIDVLAGRSAFHAPNLLPDDTQLVNGQFTVYEELGAPAVRWIDHLGSKRFFGWGKSRWQSPALAAGHMPIDASLGNAFYGSYAGAVTVDFPTNLVDGQEIKIYLKNADGTLAVTWNASYFMNGGAAWTAPTNGKTVCATFVYKADFNAMMLQSVSPISG